MQNDPNAVILFLRSYIYIIWCGFLKACGQISKNCGQVTTCYGGIQTTLFAGTSFITFSRHYVNKDNATVIIENARKKLR
jgi:hypothetical protein